MVSMNKNEETEATELGISKEDSPSVGGSDMNVVRP